MSTVALSKEQPIRILLVAEEILLRAALQKLLESWSEYEVVGLSATREETLETLRHTSADVVLLSLPATDPELDIVTELAKACVPGRLLVLVGETEPSFAAQLITFGAKGVLGRHKSPEKLRRAIQTVHDGKELWLDRASMTALINANPGRFDSKGSKLNRLTDREREVISHVRRGLTNREVGQRLFISETTVRHHLTAIFDKLQVRNRFELIDFLHRHPFAFPPDKPVDEF
jgi:DNA-binding NarL/FixJ family response regulator